jgi:integrase
MPEYTKDISHIVTYNETESMIKGRPSLRDKALISLLYLTGSRPGEIVLNRKANEGFKKTDITFDGKFVILKIKTLKLGKRGKNKGKFIIDERELEIPKKAPFMNHILRWQKKCQNEFLFEISTTRVWQIIDKASDKRLTPYNFRHSRFTKLRKLGASKDDLMEFKGAKDIRSVEPYLHARRIGRKLKFE